MDKATMGRREFLKAAGAGWVTCCGFSARSYARVMGSNERINLAMIGVGGRGARNLAIFAGKVRTRHGEYAERVTGTHIAALCDVNMRRAAGAFVGDKGMLLVSYPEHELWPAEEFEGYEPPEPSIPPSVGHYQEWLNACRGEGEALCHFGYSMPITETVLLGNVAYRSGRKLHWNAEQFTIDNAHEAEGFLQRGYRPGWTL